MTAKLSAWKAAALLCLALAGCQDWFTKDAPTQRPQGTLTDPGNLQGMGPNPHVEGTIGSMCYVHGGRTLRVRGYGLVLNLNGTGSRFCPPAIREEITREILRERAANPDLPSGLPSPEELIDSLDTAVAEVIGDIPPAAGRRRTFDVRVKAIDPDTRSLGAGTLHPCELKIYKEVGPAEVLEGRTRAYARGPVFINPFVTAGESATTINPREGIIIGGGSNRLERELNLISEVESYARVRLIRDAINRRFHEDEMVADAVSPRIVQLRVPKAYRAREDRFLEQVLSLPVSRNSIELEARAKRLVADLSAPNVSHHHVGLALEGIGVSVIPMVQPKYTHPRREVNFFAARTGLRLGDKLAIEVIIQHANDERSPYRRAAIAELGECAGNYRAGAALRELLTDPDPQIRIVAYEALRQADPESIAQVVVGREPENFLLELVPSDGPPMVYARRSLIRRIALIGGNRMACQPPLLYAEPGKPVTLSADENDQVLTLLRKDVNGRVQLGPLKAPLGVAPLVRFLGQNLRTNHEGKIQGLGLDYAVILDILYRLCETGAINADLRWEETSVEDLFGPLRPIGRPESEL